MTQDSRSLVGPVLISSRTFGNYLSQFALTESDLLAGPVLDCPGGASDFAAELRSRGGRVVSVDPSYDLSVTALTERIDAGRAQVTEWARTQPERFSFDENGVWEHSPVWEGSARRFLADFTRDSAEGTGHYRAALLPNLPFADNSFALAVSGFLLFTYADQFDYAFHLAAVRELLRVASEVRLHPLNDSSAAPYQDLDRLLGDLDGVSARVLTVRGTTDPQENRTLVLTR
ncbi:class I SAM-dependent methyltransferase [Allokutzneria albata]|uniref:SAM-dependent methyltransferase n=1 Tax=Allokutzneria albata TaxID=211114 RepID=A0A1G9THP7_ALLAB|nr:hypothetical protein [Allokutzneria albata]SDM47251.1 hypothetical protein SAMN04489726_1797 [Allokutzneria albata]